ncbi:MAG: hypothetical protein ACRDJW_09675 [Thermomicrobiales bacterium]
MFQSPLQWDDLVNAKIDDLYVGSRPVARIPRKGCLTGIIASARRPIGRAVIAIGARIAGSDTTATRPASPAHFSA